MWFGKYSLGNFKPPNYTPALKEQISVAFFWATINHWCLKFEQSFCLGKKKKKIDVNFLLNVILLIFIHIIILITYDAKVGKADAPGSFLTLFLIKVKNIHVFWSRPYTCFDKIHSRGSRWLSSTKHHRNQVQIWALAQYKCVGQTGLNTGTT